MKILIHRYNSICEPDYIDAFKSIGIEVIEDRAEMTNKNLSLDERVGMLGEMILENQPMFVFSINFFPYISMVCEKLGVRYVCVSVDCPVVELFSNQIQNKCNRVFLFDHAQYLDVYDANPECIFYMPLGVNVDRINQTIGEPVWEAKDYKYDVSFIGSLYKEKNPFSAVYDRLKPRYKGLCDGLLAAQGMLGGQAILEQAVTDELVEAFKKTDNDFYPSDFSYKNIDRFVLVNNYLSTEMTVRDRFNLITTIAQAISGAGQIHLFTRSDTDEVRQASGGGLEIHGGVRSLDEMPMVFRQSKINLNPTMRSIRTGLPQRVWDVLGAGGFLLTNYQAEIPEYLEIGTHVAAYETVDEAIELIEYYLSHEDEREAIAQAGYELVKQKHTVLHRVIDMIKVLSQETE